MVILDAFELGDQSTQPAKGNVLDLPDALTGDAELLAHILERAHFAALAEAEAIIAHAGEEAERLAVQEREKLEAALERRQKQAIDRIAQAEAQALDLVRAKTVDVALDATRDYLAKELKDNQSDALTDAAIKDLPGNLH